MLEKTMADEEENTEELASRPLRPPQSQNEMAI